MRVVLDVEGEEAKAKAENIDIVKPAGGDEIPEAGVEEDIELRQALPCPAMPTRAEIEQHEIDHLPVRRWCQACLEGRGRKFAHGTVTSERGVPLICFDCSTHGLIGYSF